jgi:nicotinamide-nucleotide amidase
MREPGREAAERVGRALAERGATLATAESCTGGLLGAAVTAVPGSSRYYRGGVVAYADEAKTALLAVPAETLGRHGAVSEAIARAMAAGVRQRLGADIGVSITGIAGPEGGSAGKPVGLVFVGLATSGRVTAGRHQFAGDRDAVRAAAVLAALAAVEQALARG